ncbi:hypothetical protein LTR97_001897 [Elasticomyces elasticus]|uniref:MYND-type domain-containing protein n=1 Tax=Elasticomyces elasticus TaxID=574655 RepID=A0AAN7VXM8_9PEZI|nr:hypothetical protein LTR97_001897 [Elasticomyces elasticus]
MADNVSAASVPRVCGMCGIGGILFRCSRCKCVYYCSTSCQKEDWRLHRDMCKTLARPKGKSHYMPLPNHGSYQDKHAAVLVWLKNHAPDGQPNYIHSPGSLLMSMDPSKFESLPVTHAIGFPLGYSSDLTGSTGMVNARVVELFVDIDVASATFGQAKKMPIGGACLARPDGRHMKVLHVEAIIEYVQIANQELGRVLERERAGENVDREEMVERLLTPKAFVRAFEKIKYDRVLGGNVYWIVLECPIKVSGE